MSARGGGAHCPTNVLPRIFFFPLSCTVVKVSLLRGSCCFPYKVHFGTPVSLLCPPGRGVGRKRKPGCEEPAGCLGDPLRWHPFFKARAVVFRPECLLAGSSGGTHTGEAQFILPPSPHLTWCVRFTRACVILISCYFCACTHFWGCSGSPLCSPGPTSTVSILSLSVAVL